MRPFFTIRMPPELILKLRKIAKKEDRSVAYLIRKFIKEALKTMPDA